MSVPYTRISLFSASRVSSSYTEKNRLYFGVDTRTCSVRRTHVRRLF